MATITAFPPVNGSTAHPVPLADISAEVMVITPTMASELLKTRPANRPVSKSRVRALIEDLRAGRWRLNGESIILTEDMRLIDGQHRLMACAESGIAITALVAVGASPDVMPSIDQGRARSGADTLAAASISQAKQVAAVCRWLWRVEHEAMRQVGVPVRNAEIAQFVQDHPGLHACLSWGRALRPILPESCASAFYNLEKGLRGGDHKSKDKNDPLIQGKLADEYQVSTTTIKNDGNFASAIDILETEVRQDIRESVLRRQDRGKAKVTKQQTMQAGALIQQQAVQPQPFMKREHWKPYQVLEAIEVLAALPTDEHAAVNHLLNGPFIPAEEGLDILKNLATMPSGKRQQIYTLHGSGDKRGQDQALALAADKAPPPDPQSQLASAMNLAIEQIRQRLRRNWINAYPNEPWSDTLRDLEADLLDMTLRLTALEEDITTTHQERMAQYATTLQRLAAWCRVGSGRCGPGGAAARPQGARRDAARRRGRPSRAARARLGLSADQEAVSLWHALARGERSGRAVSEDPLGARCTPLLGVW